MMTNEKTPLDKLIEYAETAMADGYPYEVIGEDLALTVKALRALRVEPREPQWPEGRQLQIHAGADCKPIPYEMGVTYYSCQHYPPDAMRRHPCDQGCK